MERSVMSAKPFKLLIAVFVLGLFVLLGWSGGQPQASLTIVNAATAAPTMAGTQAAVPMVKGVKKPGKGTNGKYRVALVNSFIGNDWRVQMQNSAVAVSKHEPFNTEWEFSVLNTDNT